jgi:hypothetical protein
MTYEKPESLEVGLAQEVILGWKDWPAFEADGRYRVINPMTDFDEQINVCDSDGPQIQKKGG